MPRQFLTQFELERYQNIPAQMGEEDLIIHFSLSEADRTFIGRFREDSHRLALALRITTLRFAGFFPDNLFDPANTSLLFLAHQIGIPPTLIGEYSQRANTRSEHQQAVLTYTGFRKFILPSDEAEVDNWLLEKAMEHNQPTLLLDLLLRKLQGDRIVRPGISILERSVQKARAAAHLLTFDRMATILTPAVRELLDSLVNKEVGAKQTLLTWLNTEPNANTPPAINACLSQYVYLQSLGVAAWNLSVINPNRQKLLARRGQQASPQYLAQAPVQKRYPMLVCFLKERLIRLTDLTMDMYGECIRHAHHRAIQQMEAYQLTTQKQREENTHILKAAVAMLIDEEIESENVRTQIYIRYPKPILQQALASEKSLTAPLRHKHLGFLKSRYTYLRQFVPAFLATFDFQSPKANDPFLKALHIIRDLGRSKRKLPEDTPVDFVNADWEELVFEPELDLKGKLVGRLTIHRKAYELCLLSSLRERLRSGDIFVSHSRRYANPELDLIPKLLWENQKLSILQELGLPLQASERFTVLTAELTRLIPLINELLGQSGQLKQDDQGLHLSRLAAVEVPASAQTLSSQIDEMLPEIALSDLLIEVDGWMGYSHPFTHESGSEPRSEQHLPNLYAILLSNGSNMTLKDMARSSGLSYGSLLWTQKWFIRQETLTQAMNTLVNYQHQLPISKQWGSGSMSSSDGQRFAVSGKIRNADALPRYFGYGKGITFYTHTSDQYSQYGAKVIASGEREATYMLDAILDNETDLEIKDHAADTGGYTDLMFGLFDLLGMQLSLRLRDIVDQRLHKVSGLTLDYPEALKFMGRVNLEKIAFHWDEILRVVGSLKSGWVSASLYISKLQAYPRQNKLLSALQEYGKLVKTNFILRYYLSESLQRRIHKQLNKGEALHALRRFLFFGGDNKIRRKQLEEQDHQAGCLNLLTNAVIVWNTVYMQRAIEQLRKDGTQVNDEDIAFISPSRFAHINRYGQYNFDLEAIRKQLETPSNTFKPLKKNEPIIPALLIV